MLQARLFAVRTEMADQEGEDSGQSNQSQQLRGGKYPPHPPGGIAPKKFQGEAEQGVGGQIDQQKGLPLPAPPGQAVQQKKEEQAAGGLIQLDGEERHAVGATGETRKVTPGQPAGAGMP